MDRLLPALRSISAHLEENHVQWCLRGSVERLVRGTPVAEHNDIDINTDKGGFQKIKETLNPARVYRKYEAEVLETTIEGFRIEIMSFDDARKNASYSPKKENYRGIEVYLPNGTGRI